MTKPIYFPGLNALRFYAALGVLLSHIPFQKDILGIPVAGDWFDVLHIFFLSGRDSVLLFFVLSGFLITYLLLAEHEQHRQIDVGKFYMRRILRIWPLYGLLVLIGFVIVPALIGPQKAVLSPDNPDYSLKLILHLLMLPNIAAALHLDAGQIAHLWSIGVEEQFYLLWPRLMRRFIRNMPRLLLGIIGFKVAVWCVVTGLALTVEQPGQLPPLLLPVYFLGETLLNQFQIESMAIGGLAAYLFFHNHTRILRVIYSIQMRVVIGVLMVAHIALFNTQGAGDGMLVSMLYGLFILNVACNPQPFARFENKALHYLGKISYGIYMYHLPVLYLVLVWSAETGLTANIPLFNALTYPLIVLLTIGAAALSYRFFESPFLRFKNRFTLVPSGRMEPSTNI